MFLISLRVWLRSTHWNPRLSEPAGIQALVEEVRLLRKDLEVTNGYALKASPFYRLQVQEVGCACVSAPS